MNLVFAHGLGGGPDDRAVRRLRHAGFSVVAPDARGHLLRQRIWWINEALDDHPSSLLVGFGYGGLAAFAVAAQRPGDLGGLLLLGPTLHWREDPVGDARRLLLPPELPTIVLHGRRDRVAPVDVSRGLHRRLPHVELRERDDDHTLDRSGPAVVAAVRELLGPHDLRWADC